MAVMLVDTHIHLDFLADLASELGAARAQGIAAWVVPGVAPAGWPQLMATVAAVPGAWAAPGVHPQAAADWRPEVERELLRLAAAPRTAALGEVGLDGATGPDPATQERVFRRMIGLARETGRPLLLHLRRATARALELLRAERAADVGGIAHAYSGSLETAKALIDLGFALGIGGVVTFPDARRLGDVVRSVPANWLVLETDAPDLAPHPHRGADNRAEWLTLVAARVAELRGWTAAETARITTDNARRVLRLAMLEENAS
ncbi:MAG: TatD family deoxyribonuclease [Deltaproteobacteria bacterium]|nr:MAG: TatD family deoxyribonuclease [Deltaproteobacteria bacterium]